MLWLVNVVVKIFEDIKHADTADDIAKRKGLRYREDILDNMCSEKLAANLFRITQTESKLKRDNKKIVSMRYYFSLNLKNNINPKSIFFVYSFISINLIFV